MSFSLTYCEFTNLLDASKSDSPVALRQAIIGKLMSFDTYVTQNLPSHTAGTASGYLVNSSTHAIGEKSVAVDTGSGTIKEGDIFTVAGGSETYTVTYNSGTGVLNYYPAATSAFANNAAITFTASHAIAGVFFHKSACAFVSRPMSDVPSLVSQHPDPDRPRDPNSTTVGNDTEKQAHLLGA